jgi:hypothetical protein
MAPALPLLALLAAASSVPKNVRQLNDWLADMENPRVGVLSQPNYDAVHHLLPSKVEPVIFAHKEDLLKHTLNGSVHASVMSSMPADISDFVTFSSTIISTRGMFTAEPADTLRLAIDAAIVRALNEAVDVTAAANNQPCCSNHVAVHTCKSNDVSLFPFPDPVAGDRLEAAIARGHLRVASYNQPNWGTSGDYSVVPHTGFYPDFLAAIEAAFEANYNVTFQRVWISGTEEMDTGTAVMNSLDTDEADTTEPYMGIDAFFQGRSRTHTHVSSCTTIGTDSTFFIADPAEQELKLEHDREEELTTEVNKLKLEIDTLKKADTVADSDSTAFAVAAGALFLAL